MTENSVSIEERVKVHELCKVQLGGKWAEVQESDLIISPVPGGMVNKLYFCFLPDNIKTEYNKVVVRYVEYEVLKECYVYPVHLTTMSVILSERGVSPKLLSVFHNGTINEFIKCRYFNAEDDLNDKTVQTLARKVARLHSIEMPIPKDFVEQTMDAVFNKWLDEKQKHSYREGLIKQEFEKNKHKYKAFSKLDYLDEIEWTIKTMKELNSPLVFSHNDVNRRNILIREEEESMDMFLVDFDWSNYNYRGTDIGQYFAEYRQKEIDFGYVELPPDEKMCVYIDAYIDEMCKIKGNQYKDQDINSRQQLIKESKIFALFSFLKDIQYIIYLAAYKDDLDALIKGDERFQVYDEVKTKYLEQYT